MTGPLIVARLSKRSFNERLAYRLQMATPLIRRMFWEISVTRPDYNLALATNAITTFEDTLNTCCIP
jgi:hypothetical protein